MTANTSTAVMQRRIAAPDSLDYFPTPPWATRALCEWLLRDQSEPLDEQTCWEPGCGEMFMTRPLGEYFQAVRATDVRRYTPDHGICNFLTVGRSWSPVDWVITNPPFRLAQEFIETGLNVARRGVAMLVRTSFIEGSARHSALFDRLPRAFHLQFVERVAMFRDRLIEKGRPDPFNLDDDGQPRTASTATSYCWLVWRNGETDSRLRWLSTPRAQLERPGDYPEYREQWNALSSEANDSVLL